MTPDPDPRVKQAPPTTEVSGVRRRLVRGGLSAAPLLVTLTSRPVLAQTCFSPSETLSGTLSHKGDDLPLCQGRSPGVWKNVAEQELAAFKQWKQAQAKHESDGNEDWAYDDSVLAHEGAFVSWPIPPTDAFHSYFAQGTNARYYKRKNGQWKPLSLLEVMQLTGGDDPAKIGFHFVGALLNIRVGLVDPRAMTEQRLRSLWAEYATQGYYVPYAGATRWYAADIVAYIQQTGLASY